MSQTKSSETAPKDLPATAQPATAPRASSLALTRQTLTAGGVALFAINLVMMMTGASSGGFASVLLWSGAALCFLASFVIYLKEPAPAAAPVQTRHEASARKEEDGESVKALQNTVAETETKAVETAENDKTDAPEGAVAESGDPDGKSDPPLFRRGNPIRLVRGGVTALLGAFFSVLLMAHQGHLRMGVPLGALFAAIAAWGVMDLLGTFDDADEQVATRTTIGALARPLVGFVLASVLFCATLGFATAGRALPQVAWGVIVTIAFTGAVASLFELGRQLGPWAMDENWTERPLWKRHGFWVVVGAGALYFPFMGTYSLWDPWETHYGEVAREMLSRDDWISLWWAQDGWFWSKPVLDMWMQAIAMATLGVHYEPDKMLIGDGTLPVMHPEWAVRAPIVLLTILAMYLLYKGVAKTFGRRAALLGSLVLATMPDWYFLAHQTMTDMPFVAAMTASMGLVLLGLRTDPDDTLRAYEVKLGSVRLRFTGWHLVFGAVLVCALPQLFYLFSRNFEFLWRPGAHGFRPHWDEFSSGSGGGNCGLPGNEDCRSTLPASIPHSSVAVPETLRGAIWRAVGSFEPALQAVAWAIALGVALFMSWGERRRRRIYYLAAWFFAAISTMGKGPAGFGLPILVTLAYLVGSRPGEEFLARLLRVIRELAQFEVIAGFLIIVAVALPWYVAMYVRHGPPFTDRLIFHDMVNRAFSHVHDTNEGDDTSFRFYIWQLGYALFPWTGLAPVGLMWWLRRGTTSNENERADASVLMCMWFVFGFALFSFMGTKFHHYIFPAVPPLAVLIGVVLDDMLEQTSRGDAAGKPGAASLLGYGLAMSVGMGLVVLGVSQMEPGSFFGRKPEGHLPLASPIFGVVLIVIGLVALAGAIFAFRASQSPPEGDDDLARAHSSRMLGAGAVSAALLVAVIGRDLASKPEGADQPGAIRLLHLFTYNYRRAWPDSLDFSAALAAFSIVSVIVLFALAFRAVRRHAVIGMCALAFLWGLWGLDVYMDRTAQHWGQREIMAAYYADRQSPDEVLVAYQMNWKGENFYTGNHIPAFVSTGQTFTTWLKKKREEGAKVMYFVTEHGRVGGLKGEVGAKSYKEVTDRDLCNKFVIVRAEL